MLQKKRKSRSHGFHRKMNLKHKAKKMALYKQGYTRMFFGFPKHAYNKETGKWEMVGTFVKETSRGHTVKKFLKRATARKIRRTEDVANNNWSHRLSDYWWYLL